MAAIAMANKNTDSSLELLVVIKRLADKMGINTLKSHLTKLDKTTTSIDEEKAQLDTIKIVCQFVGVSPKQLQSNSSEKSEEKYWAILFIAAILKKKGGYSSPKIASIFSLKPQTIHNKLTIFNKLNPDNVFDKDKLALYHKIVFQIEQKKIFANQKN